MNSLRAATTWPSEHVAPIVEEFVAGYHFEHYECLAERAEEKLKRALKKEERLQPWATTFRAKSKSSLREKLILRHDQMNFQSSDEIKADTWDLAGVRVILYFPSEQEHDRVQKVIQDIWGADTPRHVHPRPKETSQMIYDKGLANGVTRTAGLENSDIQQPTAESGDSSRSAKAPKKYQPRHLGYRAVHYQCKMEKKHQKDRYQYEDGDQVEIQVVSALTHAWAQAGHDLLYKSWAFGEPTQEEQRVFDALNGLIQSGDLLLEQFQWMVHGRTYRPFDYPHELQDYLQKADVLQHLERKPEFENEGVEILLGFLSKVKKDFPIKVREALKNLGFPRGDIRPDKSIAQFKPEFDCVPEMRIIVCLIADNLPRNYQPRTLEDMTSEELCYTMMSALKLLQCFFQWHEDANAYLAKLPLEPDEKASIDFVLSSEKRQIILQGKGNEQMDKAELRHAWTWFQKQTRNPKSICGLVYRVAEMGALKKVKYERLLDGLTIGSLSRSSISEIEI